MNRICIIGVGLMGGSLGLAIRRRRPDACVVGVDAPDVLSLALERGAITEGATSSLEGIAGADAVLLCVPVEESIQLLKTIAPGLSRDTVVSDIGSVKIPIMQAAQSMLRYPEQFIGGHPMTGSEHSGIRHADEFLFENATYVLCPGSGSDVAALKERHQSFLSLLEDTGANILVMDAAKHDRIAARISHVPQLLAIALVNSIGSQLDTDPELLQLSAGGFRDMTRIASSSFAVWRGILGSNVSAIESALDGVSVELERLRKHLRNNDLESVGQLFTSAERTRTSIPERSKGFLQPIADVFVFVTDQPGAVFDMTGLLSGADLNIKDIELLKIREGTGGTFRVGFESENAAERARNVLASAGYRIHRL